MCIREKHTIGGVLMNRQSTKSVGVTRGVLTAGLFVALMGFVATPARAEAADTQADNQQELVTVVENSAPETNEANNNDAVNNNGETNQNTQGDAPVVNGTEGTTPVVDTPAPTVDNSTDPVDDQTTPAAVEGENNTDPAVDATDPAVEAADEPTAAADESDEPAADPEESEEADPYDGKTFFIQNAKSNTLVMEGAGGKTTDGTNVQAWTYNKSAAQKWVFKASTEHAGFYNIVRSGTELMLTIASGEPVSGTNVNINSALEGDGALRQLWKLIANGSAWSIVPMIDENLALDLAGGKTTNGTNIRLYTNNKSVGQRFFLIDANPKVEGSKTIEEGAYTVKPSGNTSFATDIKSGSLTKGGNVQIWTNNGSAAQRLYFKYDGEGFYTISVVGSGLVFDVAGGKMTAGTNIQQWTSNGSDAQKWAVSDNGDGTYTLINKGTGLVLDIAGGKYTKGANVQGYRNNNSAAQKFKLVATELIPEGIYKISPFSNRNYVFDIKSASTTDGGKVQIWTSNDSLAQRFEIVAYKGGYRIRTAASGGWITSNANGAQVTQVGKGASAAVDNAIWLPKWNGTYFSLVNKATGQALQLTAAPAKGGSVVSKTTMDGNHNQHFVFLPATLLNPSGYMTIESRLGTVLDVRGGSTSAGAVIQAYTNKNAVAQQFKVEKYGSGYRFINLKSGMAIACVDAGTNKAAVTQQKLSSNKNQQWKFGISDGGYVTILNVATLEQTGKDRGLEVTDSKPAAGTAVRVRAILDDSVMGESWKLTKAKLTGWYDLNGTKCYFNNGNQITTSKQAWQLYNEIKNKSSETKYLIAISPDHPRLVIFQGSKGNWKPIKDFACTTGAPGSNGKSITMRGDWRLGAGAGEMEDTGFAPINAQAAREGKNVNNPAFSGAKYIYYMFQIFAIHSTLPSQSEASQMGRRLSHGCIRLEMVNAKYVYYNMPRFTKVWTSKNL